ncbi:MAG: hypothetical protein CVV64_05080 [Candidatus Wallbacteria bacterium HGW-Wallbacteria-1]|jgi:HAD superfamily hydrolase (TIGR01549 family)|uniref:HAD family hydrolase n=1 Tax=Candidatus Wallbacteria bacterium HGW-Wallbacteria-1 TaxID=2013854 RepID=A0A2N1PS26_9BACT|nr:MAG: hypothetical protein CVV64_05080 [Candidatus Wallbacteria bacterium HGW-Wallbacteria-1]
MKTKAIIFDNDNTIAKIYPDPKNFWLDVFVEALRRCGGVAPQGQAEELMIAYYRNDDFIDKMMHAGVNCDYDEFQRIKGIVDEEFRLKTINEGSSHLFADAVEIFAWARANNMKIMVATFTTREVVEAYFQKAGLQKPDSIYDWNDSMKYSWKKPDKRIIEHLLDPYGINLDEAIMVGDRITDIQTGKNAGCRSVLVVRKDEDGEYSDVMLREIESEKANSPESPKIPDNIIDSLSELRGILS